MKICQLGAKIFNQKCSFEVSILLLSLILIVSSKEFLYRHLMKICQLGAKIFNQKCSFEVSIGLLPLILIDSSKESPIIEVS